MKLQEKSNGEVKNYSWREIRIFLFRKF